MQSAQQLISWRTLSVTRNPMVRGTQWYVNGLPWWVSLVLGGPHETDIDLNLGRLHVQRAKPGVLNVSMSRRLVGRWWARVQGPTFLQHKGSDLCMDVHCPACGEHSHVDNDFVYFFQCPACDAVFEVGTSLSLKRVPEEACGGHTPVVGVGDEC